MGLLDTLFGQDDPTKAGGADNGTSSFAGLSPQASDNVSGMLSAIGQGMLAGNRYQWINPQVFAAAIKEQGSEADRAQQKRALKLILKQSNPSLSDAQLDVMANDPITAKLALSQNEAQAGVKAGQQASGLLSGLFGGGASPSSPSGPPAGGAASAAGGSSSGVQIPGSLSLRPTDEDTAVRTVLAEAGNQGPEGMKAVAGVLRNRSLLAGTDVSTEALKPNQFEPWNPDSGNDPRRFKVDSPEYQAAKALVLPVLRGEAPDPTGGATHFYAPKAQAALGRDAPSWDDGSGVDLGGHRFFRRPYAGKDPSVLAQRGAPNVQVADASGSVPLPDPLANFTPSPGGGADNPDPGAPRSPFEALIPDGGVPASPSATSTASIPPIGANRSPAPPAPKPAPGTRDASGNVRIAGNEQQTQVLEGRMGMYPPSVYGITPETQGRGAVQVADNEADAQRLESRMGMMPAGVPGGGRPAPAGGRQVAQADMPAPGSQEAQFQIPPGPGSSYGPTTQRALDAQAARQQGGGLPTTAQVMAPSFPLNDPKMATAAIPKLMQVLAIPNLPDSYKAQAKTALDYALNVVKPTDRTRQLMEAGYTPGTQEYVRAYKNLVNSDRTPSGYRFKSDGETLEAIPGGPQDPANKRDKDKAPPAGYRATDDGKGYEAIPGGPADPSVVTAKAAAAAAGKPKDAKPLPQNTIKALNEVGTGVQDTNRFVSTFNDNYAGYGVMGVGGDTLGEVANTAGRNIGGSKYAAQAGWWQDYANHRNVIRNNLFGASLTPGEKSEFEKSDINPGMSPGQIRTNLQRQADLAKAAAKRAAQPYIAQGANPDVIESAIGMPLDDLGIRVPAGGSQSRGGGEGRAADRSTSPAAPSGSPEARFRQLTGAGLTKEQAYARMREERY